ncbi:hypothetical protein BGX21_001665 [Mortierella sp. AD011]|nr:hypothetical protein BGX20_001805 [Mortierella sp. AD010]KAF9383041.1 hypothetical protein BGX21_001665 [Mortierella sp. AD011]
MFFPWTFLPLNVILAMFQFLLISTVGSILAIYSRFGDEYANSIRWVRQGGYLEMYNTLINSREYLSNKTKLILVVTILSSFAASVTDVGAVYFIRPSSRPSNQNSELVNTTQFFPFDLKKSFNGWSSFVRNGDNITHAMASMINDTNRIPNAIPGRIYTPQTATFNVGCNKMNFYAFNSSAKFLLNQGGCATVKFDIDFSFIPSYDKATVVNKPNGRSSIRIPGNYTFDFFGEPIPGVDLTYGNTTCSLFDLENDNNIYNGTTDFHRLTSSMFRDDAELVRTMEESFKTTTNETIMFSELRFSNTTLEALACLNTNIGNTDPSTSCAYVSVGIVVTAQQEVNPTLQELAEVRH